jgi:amino acid permease
MLTFKSHIANLVNKLSSVSSVLTYSHRYLSTHHLYLLLNSLALCHINYSFFILQSLNKTQLNKIISKYNDLGSIIYNCYKNTLHTKSWTSLKYIIAQTTLIYLYKTIISNHGTYLKSTLTENINKTIITRNANTFTHKTTTSKKYRNAFNYWAPIMWDNLPKSLKHIKSLTAFKKLINNPESYMIMTS